MNAIANRLTFSFLYGWVESRLVLWMGGRWKVMLSLWMGGGSISLYMDGRKVMYYPLVLIWMGGGSCITH